MTDSPLFALTMARIREFVREPGAVFWTFGFPLLITVALGIAFSNQGPPKQVVAVIEGPRAAELAAALKGARLLGMQLRSGARWGTAGNIVNARQRRLLKRLAATPMRRGHYLLSYRLAGLLFVPMQVVVLFVFARLTFGVHVQGSLLSVFALSLLGSWSFAGLGLLCAARAQNSETAIGRVNLVTLPRFGLCGVFFSSNRFPGCVQPLIRFLPLSAFNEALRHIVIDGASLLSQGAPLSILLGWAVLSASVALRLFRWT